MNNPQTTNLKEILLKKEIMIVFFAGFCITLSLFTMLNLLPLYVISTGGSDFSAGMQNSVFNISAVVLRFLVGPIADTKGRKALLLTGSFVFTTAPLAIWLAPSYPFQIIARIYHALGIATFLSSASSLIADHTPSEHRGRVIGLYRALLSFALMIGPGIGITIIKIKGYDAFFISTTFIGFVSLLAVLKLPKERVISKATIGVKEVTLNIRKLLKNRILVIAYLGIAIVSLSNGSLLSYLTLYAMETGVIDNPGIYFTIFAGAGMFATSYAGTLSDKLGREKVIWPLILCLGLGISGLSFLREFGSTIFYLSALLAGIGYTAGLSALITWIIDYTNEKNRATALVLQENSIDIAMSLGPFLVGLGTMQFELSSLFLVLGVITMLSGIGLSKAKYNLNSIE